MSIKKQPKLSFSKREKNQLFIQRQTFVSHSIRYTCQSKSQASTNPLMMLHRSMDRLWKSNLIKMLVSIGTQPVVMVPEAKHLQNVQWQRNGAIPQLITASFCGHRCEQQKRSPSISVSADSICTGNASGAVGWRAPTTTRSCSGGGGMQFDDWFFLLILLTILVPHSFITTGNRTLTESFAKSRLSLSHLLSSFRTKLLLALFHLDAIWFLSHIASGFGLSLHTAGCTRSLL